jgi:5-methyltetrahydrofolate--homocysteine methyltransferase
MRREPTQAEARLWWFLCRTATGFRFRRQEPIGPVIVDFACRSRRLIIEIDGGTHDSPDVAERDRFRGRWLEEHGWRVLRFTDDDVAEDVDAVMDAIAAVLEESQGP